jgi:hypothetical protein
MASGRLLAWTAVSAGLFLAGACSLVNAPDDIKPGTGGSGASGAGDSGGGGMAQACNDSADCQNLVNECRSAACVGGECEVTNFPAGMPCGATPASSCDLADACDGAGQCPNATLPDGTFCSDCPAGPGNCALCLSGACGDCTTRATEKSFRTPLSASGWTLTGGWAIYPETPPAVFSGPIPPWCSNGIDDDGDGAVDFPNDPGCTGPEDPYEWDPTSCSDGFDNDGDMLVDLADPDCTGPGDDTEENIDPIRFSRPVLGTDGNRKHPYGPGMGSELEDSTATSPPTVLPATIRFLSWNLDEGFYFDLKAVQLSTDGINFTSIAICPPNVTIPAFPFCEPISSRAADDWDLIELPTPAEFIDQVGYVRFVYDTGDACCNFERGWYIDALNFATDCACQDDAGCAYAMSECGTGTCDTNVGECALTPGNLGATCALPTSPDCSAPTCDDNGWCASNFLQFEADLCTSCSEGAALCSACIDAVCANCPAMQTFATANPVGWTFQGDWIITSAVRPNSVAPNGFEFFPFSMTGDPADPLVAPMLANDGSRTTANPWVAGANEVETAYVRTGPTPIPAMLTFKSWHQDRGGNDTFNLRDKKTIRVSVDGGSNWTTIINCEGNNTVPFCLPSPAFTNRSLTQWDDVSLPIPQELVGQVGIFEIFYDTVDAGQGWERGWYIDDLNIARCDNYHPPWP